MKEAKSISVTKEEPEYSLDDLKTKNPKYVEQSNDGWVSEREKDIQTVCNSIINSGVRYTGDAGSGAECPFCYKSCRWDENSLNEVEHEPDCVYLIAKDLVTGFAPIKTN